MILALLRRSTAYFNKKRFSEAKTDIEIVVGKEPNNKKAQELFDDIEKALKKENKEKSEVKAKGGKRLTIEETDGEEESEEEEEEAVKPATTKKSIEIKEVEDDEEEEEAPVEVSKPFVDEASLKIEPPQQPAAKEELASAKDESKIAEASKPVVPEKTVEQPKIEEKPLPKKVIDFKDRANKEYSNGQYGEAINFYSKAIDELKKGFKENDLKLYYGNTLSTLYSNRASSKQKIGDFKDAISDCNLSLELKDANVKVLFKKAHLLELSEKYNDSLVEYQKIMRFDSTYKQAQDGYNRVKNLLISRGELKTERPKVNVQPPAPIVETFDQLKEKGNQYFKEGNYTEALKYYTKCVDLEKQNLIAYLNRAICFVKLKDGVNALNDCNFVLKQDSKNVKALYRRALASKLLGNLNDSIRDLKELIQIEPKNTIAIKDLTDIEKELKEERTKTTTPKIEQIQNNKSDLNKEDEIKKKPQSKLIIEEPKAEPVIKKKPIKFESEITNNYEFLQAWNSVKPDDISTFCQLIEKIDAKKLAKYVGSKLDDSMLSTFVKIFHCYIFEDENDEYEQTEEVEDGYNLIDRKQKLNKLEMYEYLLQLTKVQRFDIIKMFLNNENKDLLNKCFNYFDEQVKNNASNCSFNKENLLKLKKLYGI